ncbi:23S rRNA (adenine(2030)-N(6))-methyltransferase RlmJ [Myxococcota bacterium]|nr:23S rRNA (adenine(2030)-N(6))-methyltransferase RlmJ [Myxococcota bacterium]
MSFDDGKRYEHRFHAGNVGDVWKHVALVALFARLDPHTPRHVVDTHGGAGLYELGPTGEWTEALGPLRVIDPAAMPTSVRAYVELVAKAGPRLYPGSPLFLDALTRAGDVVEAFELDAPTHRELVRATKGTRVRAQLGDGVAALVARAEGAQLGAPLVALIDPPYADRREWQDVPDAMLRAHRARPDATFVLWYPIKSWARPNAMLQHLQKAGVCATALELITSPLASKKNRLNGSGLVFVGAPDGLVEELAALGAWLGPRLAVTDGDHTVRVAGFGPRRPGAGR